MNHFLFKVQQQVSSFLGMIIQVGVLHRIIVEFSWTRS